MPGNPAVVQDFFRLAENQWMNIRAPLPSASLAHTTQVAAVANVTVRAAQVIGKLRIMMVLLQIGESCIVATMTAS
jgi:hypothetical protein